MGLNLDLSGAKESTFEALPAQWYVADVFDAVMGATKGGGKLPKDTPKIDVQFKIAEGESENRRVFASYIIAPDKVDKKPYENKAVMDGILFGFLKAAGFDPEAIRSGSFNLDLDELKGQRVRIKLGLRERKDAQGNVVKDENGNPEMQNEVKGVKAYTGESASNDNLDLLS